MNAIGMPAVVIPISGDRKYAACPHGLGLWFLTVKRLCILQDKLALRIVKRGCTTSKQSGVLEPEMFNHPLAGHRRYAVGIVRQRRPGRKIVPVHPQDGPHRCLRLGNRRFRNQPGHHHVPVPVILRQLILRKHGCLLDGLDHI